ncbi:MAG: hypothetical protein RIC55_22510 [Pirellulaceae bacterium]
MEEEKKAEPLMNANWRSWNLSDGHGAKMTCAFALLFILGACRCAFAQDASEELKSDSRAVSDALTSVRKLEPKSYHRFLRDAARILPPQCVGQPWSDVTTAIEGQMCPLVYSRDNGDLLQRYYLAEGQAISFRNGRTLDAYVWLSGKNADLRRPSRPETVFEASIMLADEINADYEELIKQERYPRGSVLDVVLRSPEVEREGSRWPTVKRVLVKYGSIITRYGVSHGFSVIVELTASREHDIGEKRMYFFVRSDLDPKGDDKDIAAGSASTDTLGAVQGFGGNEWWRSTADEKKYLKVQP